jgi:hypothetical protein
MLVPPRPAVAPPRPKVDAEPPAAPAEDPPVPRTVPTEPPPVVEPPAPNVELVCAWAIAALPAKNVAASAALRIALNDIATSIWTRQRSSLDRERQQPCIRAV